MIKIKVNGVLLSKDVNIKKGVVNAFHNLFSKSKSDWRPTSMKWFLKIGYDDSGHLKTPFSEEEILLTL